MKKEERLAKKKQEDQALNRVLLWFGGAVILEFFLLLINRFGVHFNTQQSDLAAGIFQFLRIFSWVCLACAVAGIIWWAVSRKKGGRSFPAGVCALVFSGLFLCSFVAGMWKGLGVQFLYVAVPVAAVLALIYYLYQREFFLVALQGGLALFAMWAYRKLIYVNRWLVYGLFLAVGLLILAALLCSAALQRGQGRLGKVRVLPKKANYLPLYLAGALALLSLVIAFFLGSTAAYVCLIGNVAWLFGAAVYYTVRLM